MDDDAEGFGLLVGAVLVLALVPIVIVLAAAGAIGYAIFLGGRELVQWIGRVCQPDPLTLIEADYEAARAAMNTAAGASWRELAG